MPPREGGRNPSTADGASGVPAVPLDTGVKVAEALSQWSTGGDQTVRELLLSHLEQAVSTSTALSTVPLSNVFVQLFTSDLEASVSADFLAGTIGGLDNDRIEVFGEALVDVVEVLEVEREDTAEDQPKDGGDAEMDKPYVKPKVSSGLPVVKLLLESTALPSHIVNLLLTADRLVDLGLHPYPRNPRALQSALVKKNTTLFFKQRKYNLLRECSEGFSGLIVLLTSSDALPQSAAEVSAESVTAREQRAKRVWSKTMGLIGYFNLSPPRVLDVILEIASCHVAVHWRFFLELLKCSPWGAAAISAEGKGKGRAADAWPASELIAIGQALDVDADRVLAQVLGFKFGFYQRPEGGDTPVGLVYTAALLVKHGFVSLADLLPFLAPDDTQMEDIRNKWHSSLSARSGPANALSMSVLLDDDAPASSSANDADASGTPAKPPQEQRIQLLQALLAIGDLPSSLYFLGRFPWTAQSHTAIADLVLRNIAYCLDGLYRSLAGQKTEIDDEDQDLAATAPTIPDNHKEVVPSLMSPAPPDTSRKRFQFFYPDWSGQLEPWHSIEDIHTKGLPLLALVRGLGGRDSSIMTKLCRIGAVHFATLRKEKEAGLGIGQPRSKQHSALTEEMRPWLDLTRVALLPSLSGSSATASFDIELWSMLRFFPYPVRYSLYGEWRDSTCSFKGRNPCLVAAQAAAECTKEVQKALRRVTSSSTSGSTTAASQAERYSARYLAKLSHGNPLFLWTTAVTQVKAYPNIGQAIVDAGRYMTQLSFDVATFVMLDTLSDDRAQRLNETGTGVALWLERLSKFVGDFNRRYANMDLDPVLQYIVNRLMRGHSGDLIILEKLLSTMSGMEPVPNDGVSETQLQAYAGGREMVREAFNATRISIAPPQEPGSTDKPKEAPVDKIKNIKKSLPRLVHALRDTNLAIPIWIALAQTRQAVIDKLSNTPLKAMVLVQDSCHTAFMQFGDFLVEQLSSEEQMSGIPDLAELVKDFGLEFGTAFQILRPRLNAELERVKADEKAAIQKRLLAEKEAMNGRLQSPSVEEVGEPSIGSQTTPQLDVVMAEAVKAETVDGPQLASSANGGTVPEPKPAKPKLGWPSALQQTIDQAKELIPKEANDIMGSAFFVIFWHLTMSDIAYSAVSYDAAIKSIKRNISNVSGWRIMAKDKTALAEQQAELVRLKARVGVLEKEKDSHQAVVNGPNRRRLRLESSQWFDKSVIEKGQSRLSAYLHQYCFYPRAILSPCDAVFVAKFIRTAHDLGTPGFSTLFTYNAFFGNNLAACIFSCTDSEARNLGRCLAAIMTDLDAWHRDEKTYRREALGIPDNLPEGEEPKTLPGMLFRSKPGADWAPMGWQDFRTFYAKCHKVLTRSLVSCWSEAEFMHNKNAIIVALQVIKFYPMMDFNGKAVEEAVKKLHDGEVGEITNDLKMMCLSFLTGLRKRQETRPYITPAAFHGVIKPSQPKAAPTGPRAAESVPVNGSSTPNNTNITDGNATPAKAAPSAADPKALRQKLEESRRRDAAAKAESKPTPEPVAQASRTGTPAASRGVSPARRSDRNLTPPPSGPRGARSSVPPPGPAQDGRSTPVPTGPASSRGLPDRPGSTAPTPSMGPPTDLSVDEARAAARAKKFGTIIRPAPPAASASASNKVQVTTTETAHTDRAKSPTPAASSRRNSPAPRTHRSGSVESRASVGSRRSKRDRDDRDRERDRDRDKGRERDRRGRDDRDRERRQDRERPDERDVTREPFVVGSAGVRAVEDDHDRRRKEGLPPVRSERVAEVAADDRRDGRRGSRDTASGHRRDDKDRDDRRPREKEKEKDDRRGAHRDERDRDNKRKRDEEPRRIDEPSTGPGRREDRRDRDRDRRNERPDDRDRDAHRDHSERDRADRDRRGRDRDEHDRDRDRRRRGERDHGNRDREPSHAASSTARDTRRSPDRRPADNVSTNINVTNGDRTPRRDNVNANKELLPSRTDSIPAPAPPANAPPGHGQSQSQNQGGGDRIVDTPRQPQATALSNASANRMAHALPPRPGLNNSPAPAAASPAPRDAPRAGNGGDAGRGGSSLAMRMGPAPTASPTPARRSPTGARNDADDGRAGSGEPRKRPLEESAGPAREQSPGASKRVKIDRERLRGRRDGPPPSSGGAGGSGERPGGNRMFQAAMGGAQEK
ncbi:hypothetical protein IAU60_002369 [Kwoniella sp. DSM 27419]